MVIHRQSQNPNALFERKVCKRIDATLVADSDPFVMGMLDTGPTFHVGCVRASKHLGIKVSRNKRPLSIGVNGFISQSLNL